MCLVLLLLSDSARKPMKDSDGIISLMAKIQHQSGNGLRTPAPNGPPLIISVIWRQSFLRRMLCGGLLSGARPTCSASSNITRLSLCATKTQGASSHARQTASSHSSQTMSWLLMSMLSVVMLTFVVWHHRLHYCCSCCRCRCCCICSRLLSYLSSCCLESSWCVLLWVRGQLCHLLMNLCLLLLNLYSPFYYLPFPPCRACCRNSRWWYNPTTSLLMRQET